MRKHYLCSKNFTNNYTIMMKCKLFSIFFLLFAPFSGIAQDNHAFITAGLVKEHNMREIKHKKKNR